MNRDFNFKMANGFRGTMNNVNEIAQLVKAELLNTNNVVTVNGFNFSIGGAEGAEGYALYVETTDGNPNPFDRKCYVHKIYHLGKVRRGIDKYVADFLTLNAEYDMYNTPMFVWEDGKIVKYVELNNMNDMAKNMEMIVLTEFNDYVKQVLMNDFEVAIDDAENEADDFGDDENEHYCSCFSLNNYDIRKMWADWAWENNVMNHNDAYKYYDDNRELFMDVDDMYDFLNNFYGHYIDTEDDGVVYFYVINPNFVDEDVVKNDAPCLDDKYNVIARCSDGNVKIGMDGVYDFTLDVAKEVAYEHTNMGVTLMIVKVEE